MSKGRLGGSVGGTARVLGALLPVAALALAFAPATALAQQQAGGGGNGTGIELRSGGWYSGLRIERSQIGISDRQFPDPGVTASTLFTSESSAGYKLYGGYQFNRNFAVEGGYTDLGKLDFGRDTATPALGSISSNIRSSGLHLDMVGIIPLQNGLSLFGRLGTVYSMGNTLVSTSAGAAPLLTLTDLNPRRSEWNSRYGLGASYDLPNNLGLRFGYERINNVGDFRTGDGNVGMWSLGLTKRY